MKSPTTTLIATLPDPVGLLHFRFKGQTNDTVLRIRATESQSNRVNAFFLANPITIVILYKLLI
jgi:hypothetical protein